MADREIRGDGVAIVLPPREIFSPAGAGAIATVARLLAGPEDVVFGAATPLPPFGAPRFVPVAPAWGLGGRNARHAAGMLAALRRAGARRVEAHGRADLALALARRLTGARVSLFLHNDPQGLRGLESPSARADAARVLRVVCVSGWVRDRFSAGVPGAAPAVLPNPIDIEELPPPLPAAARERVVLFAGRLVADKGADAFVRAWGAVRARCPGWRAVMIGADRYGPDSPQTPFLAALRAAAPAAGVELTGYLPRPEVLAWLARAAVAVVPSRWPEPFGLAALEAMASGAALIASPVGALPEVVGEAAVWALPDDGEALAAAMAGLAGDAARRQALAAAGMARARAFAAPLCRARLAALRAA